MRWPHRRRSDQQGAAAVEFALLAPVLFLMLLGIIEIAFLMKDYVAVTSLVRTGGRTASANVQAGPAGLSEGGDCTVTVQSGQRPDVGPARRQCHPASRHGAPAGLHQGAVDLQGQQPGLSRCQREQCHDLRHQLHQVRLEPDQEPVPLHLGYVDVGEHQRMREQQPRCRGRLHESHSQVHERSLRGRRWTSRTTRCSPWNPCPTPPAPSTSTREVAMKVLPRRLTTRRDRERSRARSQEAGAVALIVALFASVVFFGLAAIGIDTARWAIEVERVQKTADAAALAGVTFLPTDMTSARTTALAVAAKNGFTPGASTQITVERRCPPKSAQGDGQVAGEQPVREAHRRADHLGHAHRCGRLHRSCSDGQPLQRVRQRTPEPIDHRLDQRPAPGQPATDSALPSPVPANCSSTPQFWATIEGPAIDKVQGDRYMTSPCCMLVDVGLRRLQEQRAAAGRLLLGRPRRGGGRRDCDRRPALRPCVRRPRRRTVRASEVVCHAGQPTT